MTTLTRKVTVDQPVSQQISDLIHFVKRLERAGIVTIKAGTTDAQLIEAADDFWDSAHGDD